jgi:hypothetical protein
VYQHLGFEMQATGRRLPSPEAMRVDGLRSDSMRLEQMRLEADRDYMKAKISFDNALDRLRFATRSRLALSWPVMR